MTEIMFVCHGNICRSPMAEFVMKKLLEYTGSSRDVDAPWYTGNFNETWIDILKG